MAMPDLLDDIIFDVVRRVGEASCVHLGSILKAGKRGLGMVYSKEVLSSANLDELCVDPDRIFCLSINPINGYIFQPGPGRAFFEKCLHHRNPTTAYFESLRLATREQDIDGALAMVTELVPYYAAPTFAYAMFLFCAGKSQLVGDVLKIFFEEHAREGTDKIQEIGEKLIHDLNGIYPPSHDTFGGNWSYPECEAVSFLSALSGTITVSIVTTAIYFGVRCA